MNHWGDQIEFLSFVFDGFRDPDNKQFTDEKSGSLNRFGFIAATAGDAVALDDDAVANRVASLVKKLPELKESLSSEACEETEAQTARKCLYLRLFTSIAGDQGTPSHPTHAWPKALTIKVLKEIGFLTAAELQQLAAKKTDLVGLLSSRFPKDPERLARAAEAFQCMKLVHDRIAQTRTSERPAC